MYASLPAAFPPAPPPIVPQWRVGRDVSPPPASLGSAAAVLMDPVSGRVLYEHGAFWRRPPASTTKILTAYLVLRRGRLGDWVTVSPRAAATPGSRMHLTAGERLTVRALLTGLLLRSGNDAAQALAEYMDGTTARFAARMNRAARGLGALGSHFENPHGLPDPHHYTTAYDLARIARAALADPVFRHLVSLPHARVQDQAGRVFSMRNTNALLEILPGADGVKTGTTQAAGRCLVASATRGGFSLLSVVLRSPDRWGESAALLRWGYAQFVPVQLGPRPGQRLQVTGWARRPLDLTVDHALRAVVPRRLAATAHLVAWLSPAGRGRWRKGALALVVGGRVVDRALLRPWHQRPIFDRP